LASPSQTPGTIAENEKVGQQSCHYNKVVSTGGGCSPIIPWEKKREKSLGRAFLCRNCDEKIKIIPSARIRRNRELEARFSYPKKDNPCDTGRLSDSLRNPSSKKLSILCLKKSGWLCRVWVSHIAPTSLRREPMKLVSRRLKRQRFALHLKLSEHH